MPGPSYHARTHLRGGTDPIEGLEAGGGGWPVYNHLPILTYDVDAIDASGWGDDPIVDANCIFNARRQSTTASNNYIVFHMALGPKGSMWEFLVTFHTGGNQGVLEVRFATPEPLAGEEGVVEGGASITNPPTYYKLTPHVANPGEWDTYSSGAGYNQTRLINYFQIGGEDGDIHTGWELAPGGYNDWPLSFGGSGIWNIRIAPNGKNASSSNYRLNISAVTARRVDAYAQ